MTLLTYQIFKTVSEMGSFHKAADVLGLTPSAISHAVSSMEKELGFSVLTRSKNGVALTNYGEHLLPYINAVLNSDESLQQAIGEFNGLKRGKVKLGCFSSVCANWIPSILRSFHEVYPEISIELFQGTYDDVNYWIKSGVVDFGFLSTSSVRDLHIEPFYRDPLICVTPKGLCGEEAGGTISVEEMARHHFVVQPKSTDADIQKFMKTNHLVVESSYHIVDDLSMIAMVANGFGICLVPELVMHDIPYDVDCYYVEPEAARIIGLAAVNPDLMAPAGRTMYRHILDHYRNM